MKRAFRTVMSTAHSETFSFSLGGLSPLGSNRSASSPQPGDRPPKRPHLAVERSPQAPPRATATPIHPGGPAPPRPSTVRQYREEAGPPSSRSSPTHSFVTVDQVDSREDDEYDAAYQDAPLLDYDDDRYTFNSFDGAYQRPGGPAPPLPSPIERHREDAGPSSRPSPAHPLRPIAQVDAEGEVGYP
jgi:hypothetical protein